MDAPEKKWLACYRHPKRPASRDCAVCGNPICAECAKESGDPLLCLPCKEKGIMGDKPAPIKKTPRAPLSISEITVRDDGSLDVPEKAAAKEVSRKEPEVLPVVTVEEKVAPKKKEPEVETQETPKPELKEAPTEKKTRKRREIPEPLKQILTSAPYAVAAGAGILTFWLLFALIKRQWTQVSILTAGIVVPWALFKGTTAKKRFGKKVYESPPPEKWLALTSVGIMLVLTTIAQLLAFLIVFRGSDLENPFSQFMGNYFDAIGIVLVVCGFVLAFAVPLILKRGENWAIPKRKKKETRKPDAPVSEDQGDR